MGNCILLITSRKRERKKGKKEGQKREGDRSPRGDLGSQDPNRQDVALAERKELPPALGAHLFFGGKGEERGAGWGGRESSSRSGWKGTGVSTTLGAASRGDGAKDGAEQLRSRERVSSRRTSRRREGLGEERPTCGSRMYPTQLEMRSKLQFHSRRMRGASD